MVLGEALDALALAVALVVLEVVGGAIIVGESPVALVFLGMPLPLFATGSLSIFVDFQLAKKKYYISKLITL